MGVAVRGCDYTPPMSSQTSTPVVKSPERFGHLSRLLRSERLGLYLPAAMVLMLAFWWQTRAVYPGSSLAILAVVGVLALLRRARAQRWEMVVWALLCITLLFAEGRAAYRARLGSKSVLICRLTDGGGAVVVLAGDAPLHSTHMNVIDAEGTRALQLAHVEDGRRYAALMQLVPMGDFQEGTQKWFPLRAIPSNGAVVRYRIEFDSQYGESWEDLQARMMDGHVLQAYRVWRYSDLKPTLVAEHTDPGFLRAGEQLSWSWAGQATDH